MTTKEIEEENILAGVTLPFKVKTITDLTNSQLFHNKYLVSTLPKLALNFDTGKGLLCIDSLGDVRIS